MKKIYRNIIIKKYFEENSLKGITVFDNKTIYNFLDINRVEMRMKSFSLNKFIKYLIENNFISLFEFENKINDKKIYISRYFNDKSDYAKALEIATLLLPKAYISHFSSIHYYNLTLELPKKIYLSIERKSNAPHNQLNQEIINKAVCKKGRYPTMILSILGYEIYKTHSKDTNKTGIKRVLIFDKNYRITTLERTLIDIVVRSEISGGIEEVIKVYKKVALEYKKNISINKIIFILKKLNYIYPYYQIIGYLLFKNGFNTDKFKKEFEFKNNFFITRGDVNCDIDKLEYNKDFRLYIPKNLSKII